MASLLDLIKELKERTGAGLMDCKHALLENDQDIEKAIKYLREKGIAKQAKKEGRIAAEGLTHGLLNESKTKGVVIEINSETDFVAKSDPFIHLIHEAARIILANNISDLEALKENPEFKEVYDDAALKLGEKLSLRRMELFEAGENEILDLYIHMNGKITVIVKLNGGDAQLARDIALNVAANNPTYTSTKDISEEVIKNETELQLKLTQDQDPKFAAKPDNIKQKIISGKVEKILFEQVLTEEPLVTNPDKKVGQLLTEKGATIVNFVRYQVGEGIQKRIDNFADEVLAQTK